MSYSYEKHIISTFSNIKLPKCGFCGYKGLNPFYSIPFKKKDFPQNCIRCGWKLKYKTKKEESHE